MLKTKLKDELIIAMKDKNQLRVSTLRMVNASIKDLEISQRTNNQTDEISDNDIIDILVKMAKQRKEAADTQGMRSGNVCDCKKGRSDPDRCDWIAPSRSGFFVVCAVELYRSGLCRRDVTQRERTSNGV